jgi:glycosyltransferase involved in cell wall biosynthesis
MNALSRPYSKILVAITEDWFALSHFQPLLRTLAELADEVVVVTRSSGRMGEIAALGCRPIDFDFRRSSLNPLEQASVVRRLAGLIDAERPDVVHAIAMQTLVVAGLALRLARPVPHMVLHLTGLGFLGISNSRAARLVRPVATRVLAGVLRQPTSWLLAENPDDVAYIRERGAEPGERLTILGGAGIDEAAFPALPPPANRRPVAAFVGRMIRSKGVDVLVAAQQLLAERGIGLDLALYGKTDDDNPEGVPRGEIESWARRGGVVWHGHVSDIRGVWANADIGVLPAITREGLPRAVLEAAASARPLIVTDVPGCRHFVRHGIDGLIVPPADAAALAGALERLANDPELRVRMGRSARERVLDGFTIRQVTNGIREAYCRMAAAGTRNRT